MQNVLQMDDRKKSLNEELKNFTIKSNLNNDTDEPVDIATLQKYDNISPLDEDGLKLN